MKRLTAFYGDCEEAYLSCERCGKTGIHECWTQEDCTQTAVDRLAVIEDILGDEYDLDRLRELAQADLEGKIPKYTIGDTIYDRFGDAWEVTAVERRLLAGEPKWIYRGGHIGTNDYCALWEFEVLTRAEAEAALRREQDEQIKP